MCMVGYLASGLAGLLFNMIFVEIISACWRLHKRGFSSQLLGKYSVSQNRNKVPQLIQQTWKKPWIDRAQFSRLLWHPARNQIEYVLSTPSPHGPWNWHEVDICMHVVVDVQVHCHWQLTSCLSYSVWTPTCWSTRSRTSLVVKRRTSVHHVLSLLLLSSRQPCPSSAARRRYVCV